MPSKAMQRNARNTAITHRTAQQHTREAQARAQPRPSVPATQPAAQIRANAEPQKEPLLGERLSSHQFLTFRLVESMLRREGSVALSRQNVHLCRKAAEQILSQP